MLRAGGLACKMFPEPTLFLLLDTFHKHFSAKTGWKSSSDCWLNIL